MNQDKLDKAKRIIRCQTTQAQSDWLSMRGWRYYTFRQLSEKRHERQIILGTLIKRGEVERSEKGLRLTGEN